MEWCLPCTCVCVSIDSLEWSDERPTWLTNFSAGGSLCVFGDTKQDGTMMFLLLLVRRSGEVEQ